MVGVGRGCQLDAGVGSNTYAPLPQINSGAPTGWRPHTGMSAEGYEVWIGLVIWQGRRDAELMSAVHGISFEKEIIPAP